MPDETPNSVSTYVIKTNQGIFKIKAPKGTSPQDAISQAVSKSPKFAQIYPSIQSHQKMKDLASTTIQPHDTKNPVEKDPIHQTLQKAEQAQVVDQQNLYRPGWMSNAKYLGGSLVGLGQAGVGVVDSSYKLLHDIVSAVDPTDKRPYADRVSDIKTDAKGMGEALKQPFELGSTIFKVLSGHPEVAANPQEFGKKVANTAMVVDGGIKMAEQLAKGAGLPAHQIAEARRVASNLTGGKGSIFAQTKALEDAYVHTKGLDISKKFTEAAKAVDSEVKAHSKALSDQIDKGVPGGVVDAAVEAKKIADTFSDTVKTGDTFNSALKQAFKDAISTAPGQWSFEKARQFRSSIGRAMSKESGPQRAVLTEVYTDLTKKLEGTAKKYGMEGSWKKYNELERKYSQQYSDLVDTVRGAQTGKEVSSALSKNTAFTGEVVKELGKYGLKREEVLKYIADANRIAKNQGKYGSLFRLAYGTPLGLAGVIGGHAVGAGWIGSMAAGATLGYASSGLINLARSLKLNPGIIESMLKERELPGKSAPDIGSFPTPSTPPAKPPTQIPPPAPKPQAQVPTVSSQPEVPKEKQLANSAPQPQPNAAPVPSATPAPNTPPAKPAAAPQTTVAPSGQHGTGRLAKLAKKAENQQRYRDTGQDKTSLEKRIVAKQTEEAAKRAMATHIDVNQYGVPELEDALKERNVKFGAVVKWYKANPSQIEEYKEALKFMLLEDIEKKQSSSD
jgi:hypothetical protein